jgi:glycosyltransferase involved in cell wall biosynthesis
MQETRVPTTSATIVIAARDAAATVQRAVRSAVVQGPHRILLVDDHSSDDTVALARAICPRLDVVRPVEHRNVAFTRQCGLEAVHTDTLIWLDADDELLPGRVGRMLAAFDDASISIAIDEAEIVNNYGVARRVPVPYFLTETPCPVRLFERNYLPAAGVVAYRAAVATALGYDTSLESAEDVDLLLRAVAARARVAWIDETGYRMHVGSNNHSRDLPRHRAMYGQSLAKHTYESVERLFEEAGYDRGTTAWALASMATFRGEFLTALNFVADAAAAAKDWFSVKEPNGPCPLPEAWRVEFHAGTLLALLGQYDAAEPLLEQAEMLSPTAEGANNLGVVIAHRGDMKRAHTLFEMALGRYPEFVDARLNHESLAPSHITRHPFRRLAAINSYSLVA